MSVGFLEGLPNKLWCNEVTKWQNMCAFYTGWNQNQLQSSTVSAELQFINFDEVVPKRLI